MRAPNVFVRTKEATGKDEDPTDKFLVLAVNCAHLGCPVSWFPQSGLVHVPVPRRRLLRQRRAGSGPAAARAVSLRVAHSRRTAWRFRPRTIPTLQDTEQTPV